MAEKGSTKQSLTLKASRTGPDLCFFAGIGGPTSISFISVYKAISISGTLNRNDIRQITRADGGAATTLGTINVSLELHGESPVIDGTATRAITVEFHVVPDDDIGCDAMLGSDAMGALTQKYGKNAVSHDSSWFLSRAVTVKEQGAE